MKMEYYCPYCNREVVMDEEIREETYMVKDENITIDATVCICTECHRDIFVPEIENDNLRKAYDIYREKRGLLLPSEIKEIREKYKLSQTAFAKLLGMGEKTITRYENGRIQDEAQNNLILLMRDKNAFMTLLEKNGHKISSEEAKNARRAINEEKEEHECGSVKYDVKPKQRYEIWSRKNVIYLFQPQKGEIA